LSDRLKNESDVVLDTSAITRIEAGQRDPRLGEALASARVLGFGLNNLVPWADLDFYMSDVEGLMDESRAALVKMIRSVDPVVDFVRRNPDCLGDDRLEDRFREVVERFHQRVSHEDLGPEDQPPLNFAITTNRTDEKLKRQLLRAVSERINASSPVSVPSGGRNISVNSWTTSAITATPGFRSYTTPDGGRLGAWVVDQRNRFAPGMLDPDRSVRLEALPGWTWGPRARRSNARTTTPEAT
jgi:hypothetical protein